MEEILKNLLNLGMLNADRNFKFKVSNYLRWNYANFAKVLYTYLQSLNFQF